MSSETKKHYTLTEARRIEERRCPTHGLPLMPLDVEGSKQLFECPDAWCDFQVKRPR